MNPAVKQEILSILQEGRDLALATIRPDGFPQATTVSYASDGLTIYFGCAASSQKAHNLARDDRISAVIDLPYKDWSQIRGLSLGGLARRLTDRETIAKVGVAFFRKFPETAQYVDAGADLALYEITPAVISILDYGKGFGHTELVHVGELAASGGG